MFHNLFSLLILHHHAWFSTSLVFFKQSFTTLVLNRVQASLFHTFELLLGWTVFVVLNNSQSIPFPKACPAPNFSVFTFWQFWIKDPLMLEFIFFLTIFLKLLDWFMYIFNACTDSKYQFGALQCHYHSFEMTLSFS